MRKHELVDSRFLRYPTTESGMQMPGARAVFWKRTVQDGEIGLATGRTRLSQ